MAMSKKSTFTSVTPLPAGMTRQAAVAFLQDHQAMIDLNPLVVDRQRIPPPSHAEPDELPCTWYQVTDKISYLPGGLASSSVTYSCAFLDLAGVGLQTHCYAPMGVDLRTRWSVGGSAPGEPRAPVELGLDAPPTGLYLREDTALRCSVVMAGFVKKTLRDSHKRLVARLTERGAREVQDREARERVLGTTTIPTTMLQVQKEGGEERGDMEKKKNRHSSYYVQREAEAGRRAAAAACKTGNAATAVEYPRNANSYYQEKQQQQHGYASDDGRTSTHGMYEYGGGGNVSFQQHQHQQQAHPPPPQYYEAGVSSGASELP